MQEIRWKEPEIVGEIEKQRALEARPLRMRNVMLLYLTAIAIYVLFVFAMYVHFAPQGNSISFLPHAWGYAPMLILNVLLGFHSAWQGTPHFADACRVSKLGVSRLNAGENIAWRDLENYRFEAPDDAPVLRVLIVEARGRKAPLRLYYEGENLEVCLRDAMQQGRASTREPIPQGQQFPS